MLRRRHRTGPYPLAETRSPLRAVAPMIGAGVAVLLLLWVGKAVLSAFHIGNPVQRTAVMLTGENRGSVSVSLSGEEPRVADTELKLYPGDSVVTDRGSPATLEVFDGTTVRIDRGSSLAIEESVLGAKESIFEASLDRGAAWIKTPQVIAFSGVVLRTIATQRFEAKIPSGAEVLLSDAWIEVYSADGVGVTFRLSEVAQDLVVGEGQRFVIPPRDATITDPYAGRSSLSTEAPVSAFVRESRTLSGKQVAASGPSQDPALSPKTITIAAPAEGATMTTATVTVSGTFSPPVDAVRVNGYRAMTDPQKKTYSIEIALPDSAEITITVEALDKDGLVLEKIPRIVKRDRTPPGKPTISAPAGDGAVYRTSRAELEIRGTAPRGTAGIIVNDYRLQLFQSGDTTWSYLAATKLQNFAPGENIYRIVAVSEAGYRSDPVILTIILGEGEEGVVSGGASSGTNASSGALPSNAPLKPGTLLVTAPTAGTRHEAALAGTGAEFLIEGNVPAGTATVWVNDYKLQLYAAGKTFFNYIASTALNTVKRGTNAYDIIARDKDGNILDRLTYTIFLTTH